MSADNAMSDDNQPTPGQPSARAAALATEILALEAKSARQLRWIRVLLLLALVCWAAALLLWLPGGGRDALSSGVAGFQTAIALPAGLAVVGLVTAVAAATLFMLRTMNSSLESIVARHTAALPRGRRS